MSCHSKVLRGLNGKLGHGRTRGKTMSPEEGKGNHRCKREMYLRTRKEQKGSGGVEVRVRLERWTEAGSHGVFQDSMESMESSFGLHRPKNYTTSN